MNSVAPRVREIRSHIDQGSHEKSFLIGSFLFLLFVSIYYSTFMVAVLAPWYIKIPVIVVNGMTIGILFIIGHDCCHECFTPGRIIDKIYGRIAFLPSLTPFTPWWYGHNYLHHGHTNLRGRDYAWQPLSYDEYLEASPSRRWLERFYKTFVGLAINWIVDIWWKHMLFPQAEDWKGMKAKRRVAQFDRALVFLYFVGAFAGFTWLTTLLAPERSLQQAALDVSVYGFLLPFACWSVLVGVLIFVQHTHPETIWFENRQEWTFYGGQIQSTTHIGLPWPLNKIFLNVMEHNAHHVDPGIPLYRLVQQQRNLEAEYHEDMPVEPFTFRLLFSILRTCQLYDYETHQWLDFAGNPTTPSAELKKREAVQPSTMPPLNLPTIDTSTSFPEESIG